MPEEIARSASQLGSIIRRERRRQGLTQAQLAERIATRQATISNIENGAGGTSADTMFLVFSALMLEISVRRRDEYPAPEVAEIF